MSNRFEGTHLSNTVPPYATPPLVYGGNQILSVTVRTSPEVLRDLVPRPLSVNKDSLMALYVGMFNVVDPQKISYYEAGITVPASYKEDVGNYMPVLYLDRALPITIGREVWGFPKFHADFSMEVADDIVQAIVVTEGTTIIEAILHVKEPVRPTAVPSSNVFLPKSIPSSEKKGAYDVKQLATAVVRDAVYSQVRPGDGVLRLGSTASDPLGSIPILEIVSGSYTIGDSVLDYGKVLYDYLTEE